MTIVYKAFAYVFLAIQLLVVLNAVPNQVNFEPYFAEIAARVIFSITKVNNMYNFFSDPKKTGKYNYTTNKLVLFKVENEHIRQKTLSKDGSIKPVVTKINQTRVNQIQSLATRDTALYNAVVRSEALYLINSNETYPLLSVEVFHHECEAIRRGSKFEKIERIDTIYHNMFSLE